MSETRLTDDQIETVEQQAFATTVSTADPDAPGGDADAGDTDTTQVDPAGTDPAGADPPGRGGGGVCAPGRCVADPDAFRTEVWGRRPLLGGQPGGGFSDLLTLDLVDSLLAERALRSPLFRLVKDGRPLPVASYTRTGRVGAVSMPGLAHPARVFTAFDDGATIALQGMQRYWPPAARFCRELELELGHACQVNAYITPPGSRGLALHSDAHDVFVLQSFGSKQWEVHDPERGPVEVLLAPGSTLYLPTGTPHAASTQDSVSGHVTVGVVPTTWRVVLDEALTRVRGDASLDERLPVAFHRDPAALATLVAERLGESARRLDKVEPEAVVGAILDRFLTTRPPALAGGLVDRARLAQLTGTTPLRRRAASVCELRPAGDRLRVLLGDREVRVPAWLEPAMRTVAAVPPGGLTSAAAIAPDLDADSRLVLARRLVREGLLEVALD